MIKKLWLIYLIIFWITGVTTPAFAQQTIIVVPSPDVLKKGQIYPRIAYRFRPFGPDSYNIIQPSIIYGLTNKDELFGQVAGINVPSKVNPVGDVALKHVWDITDTTRLTAGIRISTNLTVKIIPTNFAYTHISQILPTGTRLTAGVYASAANKVSISNAGALLGFEQFILPRKLGNKVQFATDWISGTNPFSFLAVGFKFRPGHGYVIVPAILLPGGKNANFGFLFFIGKVIG